MDAREAVSVLIKFVVDSGKLEVATQVEFLELVVHRIQVILWKPNLASQLGFTHFPENKRQVLNDIVDTLVVAFETDNVLAIWNVLECCPLPFVVPHDLGYLCLLPVVKPQARVRPGCAHTGVLDLQ